MKVGIPPMFAAPKDSHLWNTSSSAAHAQIATSGGGRCYPSLSSHTLYTLQIPERNLKEKKKEKGGGKTKGTRVTSLPLTLTC